MITSFSSNQPPIANFSCDASLPSATYTANLTVTDSGGLSGHFSRDVVLRRDIFADFVCSTVDPAIDNTKWKACNSSGFRPVKNSTIWLGDSLDSSLLDLLDLNGKKSVVSEGAVRFTKRIWKKNSVTFNSCESLTGCSNSLVSVNTDDAEMSLEIEDNVGRSDSADYEVTTVNPLPFWEEIIPFP